jgi:hypothetical protein
MQGTAISAAEFCTAFSTSPFFQLNLTYTGVLPYDNHLIWCGTPDAGVYRYCYRTAFHTQNLPALTLSPTLTFTIRHVTVNGYQVVLPITLT